MLSAAPIPALSGGTVAVADKRAFTQPGSGFMRLHQLTLLIGDAGTHNNFVATIEGSHDGVAWFNVLHACLSHATGLTVNQLGLGFTKAIGLAGITLSFDLALANIRLGLAGDGAGGSGFVQYRAIK